jgi:hypothetical protein
MYDLKNLSCELIKVITKTTLLLLLLLLLSSPLCRVFILCTYIPETNHFPKENNVSAIISLLFMVPISLAPALALTNFTSELSEVCVQCQIRQFSLVPYFIVSWYGAHVFSE